MEEYDNFVKEYIKNNDIVINDIIINDFLEIIKTNNKFSVSHTILYKYITIKKINTNYLLEGTDYIYIDGDTVYTVVAFKLLLSNNKSKYLYEFLKFEDICNNIKINIYINQNNKLTDVIDNLMASKENEIIYQTASVQFTEDIIKDYQSDNSNEEDNNIDSNINAVDIIKSDNTDNTDNTDNISNKILLLSEKINNNIITDVIQKLNKISDSIDKISNNYMYVNKSIKI